MSEPVAPRTGLLARLFALLGSMQLAVCLLLLLGLLTWLGTLAQVDRGLWDVQREYFESFVVRAKLPLSWWGHEWHDAAGNLRHLPLLLPGAYPVMALLCVNLLLGGVLRLRKRAANVGVLVIHVGMLLLLAAGFVKLEFSYSGHLALYEAGNGTGSTRVHEASTFVSFHDYELALLRELPGAVEERIVGEGELADARHRIVQVSAAGLPFVVEIFGWLDNCRPVLAPSADGTGLRQVANQREREANLAGCRVRVLTNDGKKFEGVLFGAELRPETALRAPFTFVVGEQRWGLDLRRVVYDLPFSVRLDEFRKADHPGTTMARDFRSFVTVREGDVTRSQQIYMNNPLRKDGFTLFQTNWGPQQGGGPPWYSVFEVSHNPSDWWPVIAVFVIGLGFLLHFVMKLFRFLGSSTREALRA